MVPHPHTSTLDDSFLSGARRLKSQVHVGKRTNKKFRKNKKLSLRKMKGGSKKANKKKLKPRKSRKA